MNTAAGLSTAGESFDEKPEYLIPPQILVENQKDSESIQTLAIGDLPKLAVAPPYLSPLKGKFKLLQLWEGRVVDIRNQEFDAIITDKTNTDFPDELVTIDKNEIAPDDLPLLRLGTVFYWSVGYLDYPGRGRVRESKMRFRRLKGWTQKEVEQARRVGKEFAKFFREYPGCSS